MGPTGLINRAGDECKTLDELWVGENSSHQHQVPLLHSQKMRYLPCKGLLSLDEPRLLVLLWFVSFGCPAMTRGLSATDIGCHEVWGQLGLEQIPALTQSCLLRGLGSTPGKGQGGEWGFVEGVRRPERFFCLYLTNKTNILFRNTFKELPWSSHLSFSKTYSSRLQAACFMGWGKMNTVPAQMQGQNILLHPTLTHISCSQNTLWYAVSGDKKRIDHNY